MSRIGLVTGMLSEAARASAPSASFSEALRPKLFVSGASSARAYEGAKALVADGVGALLSFGLAGGLDPSLGSGDVVLAHDIMLADGMRLETDRAWRSSLLAALEAGPACREGIIIGQDRAIMRPVEKAALHLGSGADAVDMESHAVATAAREAGVPFMALRVILDPADQAIPWSAQVGLAADGSTQVLPVLARLLIKPWEIAALVALGRANRRALAMLGRLAVDLGPAFGFLV